MNCKRCGKEKEIYLYKDKNKKNNTTGHISSKPICPNLCGTKCDRCHKSKRVQIIGNKQLCENCKKWSKHDRSNR